MVSRCDGCTVISVSHTLCAEQTVVKHNCCIAVYIVGAADQVTVFEILSAAADPYAVLISSCSYTLEDYPVAVYCYGMAALVVLIRAHKVCALFGRQVCESFKSLDLFHFILDRKCFYNTVCSLRDSILAAYCEIIAPWEHIFCRIVCVSILLRSNAESLFTLGYHNRYSVYYIEILYGDITAISVYDKRRLVVKIAEVSLLNGHVPMRHAVRVIVRDGLYARENLTETVCRELLIAGIITRPCARIAPVDLWVIVSVKACVACAVTRAVVPVKVYCTFCSRSLLQRDILHALQLDLLFIIAGVHIYRDPVLFALRIYFSRSCNGFAYRPVIAACAYSYGRRRRQLRCVAGLCIRKHSGSKHCNEHRYCRNQCQNPFSHKISSFLIFINCTLLWI